jgi:tRNA A-37 threonylcarbamoyl transferase component Bud32
VSSAGGPGGADRRRVLVGRYRLEEVIGRGGMSTVYRGTDLALDRTVAVKVAMDPLLERDPVYTARFKREARAAASLNDPGVVTVFDAGADGPTRYIVMEYVEGRDLSEILREDGPLPAPRAARIGEQIAATLAAAHAAGIVHRDIKPGNVMITGPHPAGPPTSPDASREQVKVLDFGIARTPDGATLTQTASVLGTAPYMSPEQATGQPADARSDIYSLGCVLYEMLTGKPPFMGDMPAAVLHQHVRVAAKPPSALRPSVPPALDALVLAMLAKAPQDRPQTAAEVRDRLAAYETATEPTQPITAATVAMPAADALAVAAAAAAAAADVPLVATVPQAATPAPAAAAAAGPGAPTAPGRRGRPPRRPAGPPVGGAGGDRACAPRRGGGVRGDQRRVGHQQLLLVLEPRPRCRRVIPPVLIFDPARQPLAIAEHVHDRDDHHDHHDHYHDDDAHHDDAHDDRARAHRPGAPWAGRYAPRSGRDPAGRRRGAARSRQEGKEVSLPRRPGERLDGGPSSAHEHRNSVII